MTNGAARQLRLSQPIFRVMAGLSTSKTPVNALLRGHFFDLARNSRRGCPRHAFPRGALAGIRSNNLPERILREIRRRTRNVGAFPDGQSALSLAVK
jgi:hypothetical protein